MEDGLGKKILGAFVGAAAVAGAPEAIAGHDQKAPEIMQMNKLEYAALRAGLTAYHIEQLERAGCTIDADDSQLRIKINGFTSEEPSLAGNILKIDYAKGEKILMVAYAEGRQIESLIFTIYSGDKLHKIKFVHE